MRNLLRQFVLRSKRYLRTNKLTKGLYKDLYALKEIPRKKRKHKNIDKAGFELISTIHKIFKEADIMYFLDFGTLLGMVREQGFIKHDLDIDIAVVINARVSSNLIKRIMAKNGFVLRYEYIFNNMNVEDSFLYKGVKVDICYYTNNDQSSRCWLFYRKPDNNYEENYFNVVEFNYSKITKVKTIKIGNTELQVPINAERVLKEKYGNNWSVPDKNWVYWKAPNAKYCNELGYRIVYNSTFAAPIN